MSWATPTGPVRRDPASSGLVVVRHGGQIPLIKVKKILTGTNHIVSADALTQRWGHHGGLLTEGSREAGQGTGAARRTLLAFQPGERIYADPGSPGQLFPRKTTLAAEFSQPPTIDNGNPPMRVCVLGGRHEAGQLIVVQTVRVVRSPSIPHSLARARTISSP